MARLDRNLIRVDAADDGEPVDTSLTSNRGLLLRPLDRALSDFVEGSAVFRNPDRIAQRNC